MWFSHQQSVDWNWSPQVWLSFFHLLMYLVINFLLLHGHRQTDDTNKNWKQEYFLATHRQMRGWRGSLFSSRGSAILSARMLGKDLSWSLNRVICVYRLRKISVVKINFYLSVRVVRLHIQSSWASSDRMPSVVSRLSTCRPCAYILLVSRASFLKFKMTNMVCGIRLSVHVKASSAYFGST